MAAYRVYCIDGVGKVQRAEWVEASDDEQALKLARVAMGDCPKCEVWLGDRLVGRLTAEDWRD